MAAAITTLAFTACSGNIDNVIIDEETSTGYYFTKPVTDVIKTNFEGDVMVYDPAEFDETTAYVLSRVKGQVLHSDASAESIPENVKAVFIGEGSNLSISQWKQIKKRVDNGTLIAFLHKPTDVEEALIQLYFYGIFDNDDNIPDNRSIDLGHSTYDLVGFKSKHRMLHLHDVHNPNAEEKQATVTITSYEDNDIEHATTRKETFTIKPRPLPDAYDYGLHAEEVVEWMNETEEEYATRAAAVGFTRSYTDPLTPDVVCNDKQIITLTFHEYAHSDHSDGSQIYAPNMTIRLWAAKVYSFDDNKDFYHIITEEELGDIYEAYRWRSDEKWVDAAFTLINMNVRASLYESEYGHEDQWNVQPWAKKDPTTESDTKGFTGGFSVTPGYSQGSGASISGSAAFSWSRSHTVNKVTDDVDLNNESNDNYMNWAYSFNNQPAWSGSKGKKGSCDLAENAACGGNFTQQQSWDWIIANTKQRGANPLHVQLSLSASARIHCVERSFLKTSKHDYDTDVSFSTDPVILTLPVPERFMHRYEMTLDSIPDPTEFNSLTDALNKVSTNYNELYTKLFRKDADGSIMGRCSTTEDNLKLMVGKEWYNLAADLAGKKITVKNTYKFYIKDETGAKLKMLDANGNQKGTYLVITSDGISIANE